MAARSPLAAFRAMRDEAIEESTITYRVPLYIGRDPSVVVEFRPLQHGQFRGLATKVSKAKDKAAAELDGTINLLTHACIGVWLEDSSGERTPLREDPEGGSVTFDENLAKALGLGPESKAGAVVRELFVREPDIISAGGYLAKESGYRDTQADEALQGE